MEEAGIGSLEIDRDHGYPCLFNHFHGRVLPLPVTDAKIVFVIAGDFTGREYSQQISPVQMFQGHLDPGKAGGRLFPSFKRIHGQHVFRNRLDLVEHEIGHHLDIGPDPMKDLHQEHAVDPSERMV